jgi:flavin-dependent dehydrogenase
MDGFQINTASVVSTDICVIGGGPAGATIAHRLAVLGHRVCLVEQASQQHQKIGEALPPNILPLLASLGLQDRVERASFVRPKRSILRWSGAVEQVKPASGQPGFIVDRGRFDQSLLEAASEAGVKVFRPAQALRPTLDEGGWVIPVCRGSQLLNIKARFIADATGKRSVTGGKRKRYSAITIAMYAYWKGTGFDREDIFVEAGAEEWFWGATLPNGTFNAMVFTDPQRCRQIAQQRRGLESLYFSLLSNSSLLRRCLAGTITSKVLACDASSYVVEQPVDEYSIKVGEASFSVDPLSSQGVQMAILSGLQGSIVVNTLLTRPEHSDAARQFYQDRRKEAVARHSRIVAQFYSEASLPSSGRFWEERSILLPQTGSGNSKTNLAVPCGLRLRLSDEARFVVTPRIAGNIITNARALVHPQLERPVVYLNNVEVSPLLETISQGETIAGILGAWSPHVSPREGFEIANWLYRAGILVDAPDGERART